MSREAGPKLHRPGKNLHSALYFAARESIKSYIKSRLSVLRGIKRRVPEIFARPFDALDTEMRREEGGGCLLCATSTRA